MVRVKKSELPEVEGGTNEQIPPVALAPEVPHFVFKSKYKEDKVTLKKGIKEQMPDGSARVQAPVLAEFSRFTWSTDDPVSAETLRGFIAQRLRDGVPLHIQETTTIKDVAK
jgi:hypothetical protein